MGRRLLIATSNLRVIDTFHIVFALIGPILPFDVAKHAMIATKSNSVVLVGGDQDEFGNGGYLNTLLELEGVTSKWKEIQLPLEELRIGHIAFKGTTKQTKIFCGK